MFRIPRERPNQRSSLWRPIVLLDDLGDDLVHMERMATSRENRMSPPSIGLGPKHALIGMLAEHWSPLAVPCSGIPTRQKSAGPLEWFHVPLTPLDLALQAQDGRLLRADRLVD